MANADKNIVITPSIGSTTVDPAIVFSGANASVAAQNITARVYPTSNGTLSFEGSAGQLFSITNSLTGTIFSVNDVSGIPSIEVLDTGLVKLAQYSGNVLIGTGIDAGTGKLQVAGAISPTVDNTYNIGTASYRYATVYGVTFNGVSNTAKYADLAEKYTADADYAPGTIVVFGGTNEITTTTNSHDPRVAGIVSTNPAYLMNADTTGLPVALTGRVPCQVIGIIEKGDRLVTSAIAGVAQRLNTDLFQPGCIIGKSLENYNSTEVGMIEVVVGRF